MFWRNSEDEPLACRVSLGQSWCLTVAKDKVGPQKVDVQGHPAEVGAAGQGSFLALTLPNLLYCKPHRMGKAREPQDRHELWVVCSS